MSELDWILLGWWAAVATLFIALRGVPRVGDARLSFKATPTDELGGRQK